jgi:hypothetical protein
MKVIIFEGSAEDFKTMFPQISTETVFSATLSANGTPDGSLHPSDKTPPQNAPKRGGKPWRSVTAEADNGSIKNFRSILKAYRWYCNAGNTGRAYRTYDMFRAALMKTPLRFADTTLSIN